MSEKRDHKNLEASTRRWMWVGLILMVAWILLFPIYRIYEPAQRAEAREAQSGFLADQGEQLFEGECSSCHGPSGRGGIAPAVGSRDYLESVSDLQTAQLIGLGVPGTEMVAYSIDHGGPMTSQEIKAITVFLRSLEEESVSNPNWRTPLADANLSAEDLFTMACARCHGVDRKGIEDVGPDLSPTSFALEESDEWLAERISTGQDGMPRFGGVLTSDQIDSIVVFLRGGVAAPTPTTTPGPGPTTTPAGGSGPDEDILVAGKQIYDVTAGGVGCASCHAFDGQGTNDGPNIIGSSKSSISGAMGGGVPDMDDIKLSSEQLEAVYQYLRTLTP